MLAATSLIIDPVPQDAAYHQFADSHTIFGVSNFWNVFSNVGFLVSGSLGLWYVRNRDQPGIVDRIYPAYVILFAGVFATGFSSGSYHLSPDNASLVWDRLTMTIVFMAFFTVVIGEHVCETSARRLLIPLLIAGAASVFYWQYTESVGTGDLRPYALVQFLPLVMIPMILIGYRSTFGSSRIFWIIILLYVLSKLLELLDQEVYMAGGLISGHSLKHVVSAMAPLVLWYGMTRRSPVEDEA
jgi:hypothetical protein